MALPRTTGKTRTPVIPSRSDIGMVIGDRLLVGPIQDSFWKGSGKAPLGMSLSGGGISEELKGMSLAGPETNAVAVETEFVDIMHAIEDDFVDIASEPPTVASASAAKGETVLSSKWRLLGDAATFLAKKSLAHQINLRIKAAMENGETPVVICDIDGTVVNARNQVQRIVVAGLGKYILEIGEVRSPILEWLENADPSIPFGAQILLWPLFPKKYWGITEYLTKTFGEDVSEKHPVFYKYMVDFFNGNFFRYDYWAYGDRIFPVVDLLGKAHARGARVVFVSLRDVAGKPETIEMLKSFGALKKGSELALKDGETGRDDLNVGENGEPRKSIQAEKYFASGKSAIRNPRVVAVIENDPVQLKAYYEDLGSGPLYIDVLGDRPPNTEDTTFPPDMPLILLDPRDYGYE